MSVNPIKGKFIKISNEEALKGAKQDGSDKEILKVNSADKVVLLDLPVVDDGVHAASNVATEAYVDSEIATLSDSVTQRMDDHVGGFAEKHPAHDIVFTPTGATTSTDVQSALEEIQLDASQGISDAAAAQSAINAHLIDTVDAHDASAISVIPAGNLGSSDAQAAFEELQGDIDAINTTIGGLSFLAEDIAFTPAGNIAATDVQAALQELDDEKVAKAGDTMTGALVMDHANISQDFSVPGVAITTELSQNNIILHTVTDLSDDSMWSSATQVGLERLSLDQSTSDVNIYIDSNHGSSPLFVETINYESNYNATIDMAANSVNFSYADNNTGISESSSYSTGGFGFTSTNSGGTYTTIQADTMGISVGYHDGVSLLPVMPTFDFQLAPKKYVDDGDAAQASALSAHLSDTVDAHDASAISFVASGNIAATDVQAALQELDSEKVKKSGDTMTGTLTINPASGDAADLNGKVVFDSTLAVGHMWGAGASVISVENSNDELYIQSEDKLGGALTGTASHTVQLATGWVEGAASGFLNLQSGAAIGGTGNATGNVAVGSGAVDAGAIGTTGYINAKSGDSRSGNSGQAYLHSGNAITSGSSGAVAAYSGTAATGNSGTAQLNSGAVSVQGSSGVATVFSGSVSAGSGASGNVNFASGSNSGTGTTGTAQIQSGVISNASSSQNTGFAQIRSGNNAGSGASGVVYVASGNNTGTGNSGNISLYAGAVNSGTRGKITLESSLAEVYSQLDMKSNKIVSLSAGSASGDAVEYSQYTTALALKANKDLSNLVVAPLGAYSFPSSVNFTSGWNDVKSENATGSNSSGGMGFKSGDAVSGNSGVVALGSGDSTSGSAGDVYIFSGMGASGRGIVQVEASKLNMLNAIDMNAHQINELADGTVATDAVNKGQLDDGLALKLDLAGGDMSGDINMQNHKILHLTMNTDPDCAATKQYVDNVAEGLHVHAPVRALINFSISGTYDNGTSGVGATITPSSAITSIDGLLSFAIDQRIIVNAQSNSWENGVYVVSAINGSNQITELTRASDFDTPTEVAGGDFIFVQEGDSFANSGWVETKTTTALGFGVSDPIQFLQFSGAGSYTAGDGLNLLGTVFSVDASDLIGFGVGTDGSNNFWIASEAAGDGISGGDGVALSVDHDGEGLEFIGGQLALKLADASLEKGIGGLRLPDVPVIPGAYASLTSYTASLTINSQGIVMAATESPIEITASQVSDFTSASQDAISVTDTSTVDLSYSSGIISADVKYDISTLTTNGSGLAVNYGSTLTTMLGGLDVADGAITESKLANLSVSTAKIQDDAVDKSKIALDVAGDGLGQAFDGALKVNVDGSSIEIDLMSDYIQVKNSGIVEAKLANLSVSTAKIQDDAVDKSKIASDVAGDAIGQAIDGSLKVNVDGSSIEIDLMSDYIQVKDSGIVEAKLANLSVSTAKIQDDAVDKSKINSDVAGDAIGQAIDGSLKVNVDGSSIEIDLMSDHIQVKNSGIVEAKLANLSVSTAKIQDDAVDKSKIASDVAGDGLQQALDGSLQVKRQFTSIADLSVSSSGVSVANRFNKQTHLLTSTQSSGAFYDLAFEVEPNSLAVFVDRLALHEGSSGDGISDFYLTTTGGVTRIHFQGAVVTPGQQQLGNGDRLFFSYQKKAA